MVGCYEPNFKLREAQRLFEDQIVGPESIANIGGQCAGDLRRGWLVQLESDQTVTYFCSWQEP